MGVPRKAKWNAETVAADSIGTTQITDDAVTIDKIHDAAVGPDQIVAGDDFIMGTVQAVEVTGTTRLVTKQVAAAGVDLAALTAAFGAPVGLPNGSLFVYKNTSDNKTYLVTVIASVFQVEELAPVTA